MNGTIYFRAVKQLNRWPGVLWAWYYFIVFALIFLLLAPAFYWLLRSEQGWPAANKLRVWWARVLFLLTGIMPRIRYQQELDRQRPYIFCANHFSYLDIPLAALVVRQSWRFMAKAELNNIPLLNIFFRTIDISVNREKAWDSFQSYEEARRSLQQGMNIVIFPEGRISPHAPALAPLKNGPFRLAIETQVPIVTCTMLDNWKLLQVDGWVLWGRPGITRVIVHKPIETVGMTLDDVPALKEKVFTLLQNDLSQFSD